MVVRGLSWVVDGTLSLERYIVSLYRDANNNIALRRFTDGRIAFGAQINGTYYGVISTKVVEKYRLNNIVIVQNDTSLVLYLMKNNDTYEKLSVVIPSKLAGLFTTYLMQTNAYVQQSNAYVQDFIFLPDYVPTDAEATAILTMADGNKAGIVNKAITGTSPILPNNRYSLSGGSATLYYNNIMTRTVSADFTTNGYENKIVVNAGAVCKLKMM
jgi:hypothetical protein